MSHVWINGDFVDAAAASIPVADAGLLHAAGVFTTMRAANSKIFRLSEHLRRLRDSCDALWIPLPMRDEILAAAATELLRRNELASARLRLTVTRGSVRRDPLHGPHSHPTVFMTAAELPPFPPDYYQTGMTVILLDEQKLNPHDVQAGHKTLNYLSRQSALRQAERHGAGEALWFDIQNRLQSACVANVFVVHKGKLLTPPTAVDLRDPRLRQTIGTPLSCVLPGITRAAVLGIAARNGIETALEQIDIEMLLAAEEVFLTNSIQRVMPVYQIERHTVGAGKPGPITARVADLLDAEIAAG